MKVVNLASEVETIGDPLSPLHIAEFNGHHIAVVKTEGEFVWHSHADTDDFFLVLDGLLKIDMPSGSVELNAGDLFVVPAGVEHRPRGTAKLLLIERAGTVNKGD